LGAVVVVEENKKTISDKIFMTRLQFGLMAALLLGLVDC
jgi:hypothetical protein